MRENDHILFAEINRLTKEIDCLKLTLESLMRKNSNLLDTNLDECEESGKDEN